MVAKQGHLENEFNDFDKDTASNAYRPAVIKSWAKAGVTYKALHQIEIKFLLLRYLFEKWLEVILTQIFVRIKEKNVKIEICKIGPQLD